MSCDPTFLQYLDAAVGVVMMLSAADNIRRMNHKTRESVRWAFIMLAVGGFLLAAGPFFDELAPSLEVVVAHVGVVALLLADRRRPSDCPRVDECSFQKRAAS